MRQLPTPYQACPILASRPPRGTVPRDGSPRLATAASACGGRRLHVPSAAISAAKWASGPEEALLPAFRGLVRDLRPSEGPRARARDRGSGGLGGSLPPPARERR